MRVELARCIVEPMMDSVLAKDQLQREALALGFSLFGVARAQTAPGFEHLIEWIHRGYAKRIAALKKKRGVGFACMIHDIIPLVERDRVDAAHVRNFRRWLPQMLRVADRVFTPSDYARADLQKYARKKGWKMPPVSAIRYGPGLLPRETPTANAGPELPQDFVACVSTITAHKNQAMLVRLWRRLLQRHEAASVPHLVLVGAIGGKPESFRAELAQSAGVREKIIVLSGLTDAELASVYARCRLTLFPSFSEGWGLPVEESLAFGKFCISSNRASLPEVGGDWVDYFDPGNDAEAYAAIERALFQPGYLEDRTARIQRDYRAPTWTACARHLVATIDAPGVAASSR